jgi:peptidoglycan/xylan/chitin deacetylase (PgdA/CDA1 family)
MTKVGLIFDDGFLKSTLATAALFDQFKLPAVFAVVAEPKDFAPGFVKGDFALWNELQNRGHIILPHGYTHAKLPDLPHEQAVGELERCLDTFAEKLHGFDARNSVYCYAYNSGTKRLNQWLLPRVKALRQGGTGMLSSEELASGVWHSDAYGPDDPGDHLIGLLDRARKAKPDAFLFSLHGIDGEAWGAIALATLRRVLETIQNDPEFEYWQVGR